MSISGRKIAITGAGRGLGEALAITAADRGALPILLGRAPGPLDHVAGLIEGRGHRRPDAVICDLADIASVAAAAERTLLMHPDLDILVNSGSQWKGGAFEALSDADLSAIVDSTLTGTMALTRRLLPALRARPRADIHTVVSMSGLPYARLVGSSVAFRAAKAGQDGFVQALVEELKGTSVRVTSVHPGHIEDVSPVDAGWGREQGADGTLTDKEVVEAILFALEMPQNVAVRSLVIERNRSEFLD